MDINKELLECYKSKKWFACQVDDGFVASANTLKELLVKCGKRSATYVGTGEYEFQNNSEHYGYTTFIYKGVDIAQRNGFNIDDDENNTWHVNDESDFNLDGVKE